MSQCDVRLTTGTFTRPEGIRYTPVMASVAIMMA
ncbi:CRISPR-associated DxTHG motif protein [Cobetia crustatorum]|uniref:CRISPR-associated DxTHG motif protein n=1 Tax=Cobetia crustatorum TaxID=553385 RepID=A0A558HSC3_9GAMM|nr:CRISPR-associated DxTHG motif protein [Cobetia crustatorum]